MRRRRAFSRLSVVAFLGVAVLVYLLMRSTGAEQVGPTAPPVEAARSSPEPSVVPATGPVTAAEPVLKRTELSVTVTGTSDEAVIEVAPEPAPLTPTLEGVHATVADGGAQFSGLEAGLYRVRVSQMGVPVAEQDTKTVQLGEGRRTSVVLHAKDEVPVAGRVVDFQGHPVEAEVFVTPSQTTAVGERPSTVKVGSDAAGHFRVKVVSGALVFVSARADGFLNSHEVETRAGDQHVLVQLKRTPIIRVRVLRGDGSPVTSVLVNRSPLDDALGRFAVPFYATQFHTITGAMIRLMTFSVSADGLVPYERQIDEPTSDLDIGDIVMGPGRGIRGRVVELGTARPIQSARVTVGVSVFTAKTVTTQGDGEFELPDPKEGVVELEVKHPAWVTTRVQVPAGDATVTVVMTPGAEIQGTIERGREVNAESVVAAGSRLSYVAVKSDHSFVLSGLAEGRYQLFVLHLPPAYLDALRPVDVLTVATRFSLGREVDVKVGQTTTVVLQQ